MYSRSPSLFIRFQQTKLARFASTSMSSSLLVLSPVTGSLTESDKKNDALDLFNHPRVRRVEILRALQQSNRKIDIVTVVPEPDATSILHKTYKTVCSDRLLDFLTTAWNRWKSLGEEGRDELSCLDHTDHPTPALIPSHAPVFRSPVPHQPSESVIGQIAFYCNDHCTPVFADLAKELAHDAAVVQRAVQEVVENNRKTLYLLQTHPGHHAAYDSFGGYCYLNHAAALATMLQQKQPNKYAKVAVLDVDYHCGNGTASIFYDNPSVLVVSLHCHPDWEYPFHTGFAEEKGKADGVGTTLHLPLPPQTVWKDYQVALQQGLKTIRDYGATALVVSLGLDTYYKDPCAVRRAGFCLQGEDYEEMGRKISKGVDRDLPVIFVQEGGYRMDQVGMAAMNVVTICAAER